MEFKILSDVEFNALTGAERREYLKKKREIEHQKMLNDSCEGVNNKEVIFNAPVAAGSTSKHIEDIDINLIDTDGINEELFGFEDLDKIKESFEEIGNNSVIYVYKRDNGRYLCYAGNQRLLASKDAGENFITCVIEGSEPDEATRVSNLIFMNAQRTPRPYYIAKQIDKYERVLRNKGCKTPFEEIEKKFSIKPAMQRVYRQILKLNPALQELFKRDDIPMAYLVQVCNRIPDEGAVKFAELFNEKCNDTSPSIELINACVRDLAAKGTNDNITVKRPKTSQMFKSFTSLPYFGPEETVVIPEKKKKEILEQANELEEYIRRIKEACVS